MRKEFIIPNQESSQEVMKTILTWAGTLIENSPMQKNRRWIPLLCFEELITNIFRYGKLTYPSIINATIEIQKEGKVRLFIQDQGQFFDIKKHIVKRTANQIGGGGIPLIKSLMQIKQHHEDGFNCTELILNGDID